MIVDYADKKALKKIKLEKSPNGNVVFSEEKYNEDDGVKYFKVAIETNPEYLEMSRQDLTRQLEMQQNSIKDTQALIKATSEMIPDAKAVINPPAGPTTSPTTSPTAPAPSSPTTETTPKA